MCIGFLLELNKGGNDGQNQISADSAGLLSITDPIHIVMMKTDVNGETNLVSSHFLEWRSVLTMPLNKQTISIELMGTFILFYLITDGVSESSHKKSIMSETKNRNTMGPSKKFFRTGGAGGGWVGKW